MLSVADIPLAGFRFRGIIGSVLLDGREYRLATYLGTKAAGIRNGRVRVVQGSLELEAVMLERTGKPLRAPEKEDMVRTVHENAACRPYIGFGPRVVRFWRLRRTGRSSNMNTEFRIRVPIRSGRRFAMPWPDRK